MSGMPLQYAVTSVADSVVRRALVRSIGSCIHSDGIAPLPAVGILIRLLSYHELPPGAMFDDSAFLSDLIEVRLTHGMVLLVSHDCVCTGGSHVGAEGKSSHRSL